MNYKISISKHGKHYFSTTEESLTCKEQCAELFKELTQKFPAKEGYVVTVTEWKKSGTSLTEELVFQMVLDAIERNRANKPKLRGRQKWQQQS